MTPKRRTYPKYLYHGSHEALEIGTVMRNRDPQLYREAWSDGGFYDLLEKHRPADAIPHHEAVFACDNIDDIDNAGGMTDAFVLTLAMDEVVSRYDMNWSTLVTELHMEEADEADIKAAALAYWSGEPHPSREPVWEYLARSATVMDCQEFAVADEREPPAATPHTSCVSVR